MLRRSRSRRGDDGVAVVELALVLPVLMVLLLGTISAAVAWNQSLALGHGTRVAGRWASTMPLPAEVQATTMDPWLDAVVDRAIAASEGQLGDDAADRTVCAAYVDPPTETYSRTLGPSGARTSATAPCAAVDPGSGRVVQVTVSRAGIIDTGLYRFPIEHRRQVVYRYEAFVEL